VRIIAEPLSLSDTGRFARVAVRAEDEDGPWLDLALTEVLMPKGPIGRLPPGARKSFLNGAFVEGAALSSDRDGETALFLADVKASDWLPGTLERAYRLSAEGDERPREIAVKEHAGRLWGVHPREVEAEGDLARCGERTMTVKAQFDGDDDAWRIMAAHDE
jgi:hypothetical protein